MEKNFHPKNPFNKGYDFDKLEKVCPELKPFLIASPKGGVTIDYADPEAVKAFNKALLKTYYRIARWDIPAGYLCPPIPGRADYIYYLGELADRFVTRKNEISLLDIGTGANCIYPVLAASINSWTCVGVDIDDKAVRFAENIVKFNPNIQKKIALVRQEDPSKIFEGIIMKSDRFTFSMCNPPFHSSEEEALEETARKWKGLKQNGKGSSKLNFGGQANELYCEGGEYVFIQNMIKESSTYRNRVMIFTTLVSKAKHVAPLQNVLQKVGVVSDTVIEMEQGNKKTRILAWTFKKGVDLTKMNKHVFEKP